MTSRTMLLALVCLFVGAAGGWLLRGNDVARAPRGQAVVVEPEKAGAQEKGDDGIMARLDRLETLLLETREEISASSARRATEPEAAPVGNPTSEVADKEDQAAVDPAVARIEEELKSLGERMDSLRQAVAEGCIAARFPAHDMISQAPAEQNRARISQILSNPAEGEGMKWMSQQDVLVTLGRPYTILKRGHWGYWIKDLPQKQRITIRFVDDYVAQVYVANEWQDF